MLISDKDFKTIFFLEDEVTIFPQSQNYKKIPRKEYYRFIILMNILAKIIFQNTSKLNSTTCEKGNIL